jgi:hypothetical protein
MRNSSLAAPPYNQNGPRELSVPWERSALEDPIRRGQRLGAKGEPPTQRTGGPKRSLLGQPGPPRSKSGRFLEPAPTQQTVQGLFKFRFSRQPSGTNAAGTGRKFPAEPLSDRAKTRCVTGDLKCAVLGMALAGVLGEISRWIEVSYAHSILLRCVLDLFR